MTREEAIEIVKSAFSAWESEFGVPNDDWSEEHEALDMAIEALKREPSDNEPQGDLISRAEAIRKVASYIWHLPNSVYPHFNGYNVIENFVMDALSALPSAEAPRPIDPTIEVDLESGLVPRSACEPRGTKTIVYENNERGKHKMKKPAKPDEAIEVTKKAPEKVPLGATSGAKDANKAPTSSSEEFRGRLARSIKAAGRWMEDNAKGISGSVEGRRSLDIHLSWECSGNEIAPTINIDSDFICREAIAEMHRKEIEK